MHGINSIFYMFKTLKDRGIDWLIMADEDVVFKNTQAVLDLVEYVEKKDYIACGVRDGGVVNHRNYNPYAINTFFSILNFRKVQFYFNKAEIKKNQYIENNEFKDNLLELPYSYNVKSLYEPYYCFYFWLRRKGMKILFLDAEMADQNNDPITNRVYDLNGKIILSIPGTLDLMGLI